MSEYKTYGIVLRVFDYRETSQIFHMLTPEKGNLSVIARGIYSGRKRGNLPPPLEPFTLLHVVLHYKTPGSMAILKEGAIMETWSTIRTDLKLLAVASLFFEIIDKSVEGEKDSSALFNLVEHLMKTLSMPKIQPLTIAAQYLIKMIAISGYQPQLDECAHCKSTHALSYFSHEKGGVLCSTCGTTVQHPLFRIDTAILHILRRILATNYETLPRLRLSTNQAKRIIMFALELCRQYMLASYPRSWNFFRQTAFSDIFENKS